VWPDEDAEHSIEHRGGEEAAPEREAALERGAACALGSRGRWCRASAVGVSSCMCLAWAWCCGL
jgi:hypothetical protein